jgi:hypothetical protein
MSICTNIRMWYIKSCIMMGASEECLFKTCEQSMILIRTIPFPSNLSIIYTDTAARITPHTSIWYCHIVPITLNVLTILIIAHIHIYTVIPLWPFGMTFDMASWWQIFRIIITFQWAYILEFQGNFEIFLLVITDGWLSKNNKIPSTSMNDSKPQRRRCDSIEIPKTDNYLQPDWMYVFECWICFLHWIYFLLHDYEGFIFIVHYCHTWITLVSV